MTRLHVDINRSIAYYRTTLSGAPPKRVFLTGGSSQLPYLDLFIADKLSLPVAYFNPLRNVNLGPSLNAAISSRTAATRRNWSAWPCARPAAARRKSRSMRRRSPPARTRSASSPTTSARSRPGSLLFVCMALYYCQQTQVAQTMAADAARQRQQPADARAARSPSWRKKQDALQQTLDSVGRRSATSAMPGPQISPR